MLSGIGISAGIVGLMGLVYIGVLIYVVVLATRFVQAVERFVAKYNPR